MIASSGQVDIGVLDSHFNKLCLFVELVRVHPVSGNLDVA